LGSPSKGKSQIQGVSEQNNGQNEAYENRVINSFNTHCPPDINKIVKLRRIRLAK
jgi:hypothetical protein